ERGPPAGAGGGREPAVPQRPHGPHVGGRVRTYGDPPPAARQGSRPSTPRQPGQDGPPDGLRGGARRRGEAPAGTSGRGGPEPAAGSVEPRDVLNDVLDVRVAQRGRQARHG